MGGANGELNRPEDTGPSKWNQGAVALNDRKVLEIYGYRSFRVRGSLRRKYSI